MMCNLSLTCDICLVDVETGSVVAPTVDDDVDTGQPPDTRRLRAVRSGREE